MGPTPIIVTTHDVCANTGWVCEAHPTQPWEDTRRGVGHEICCTAPASACLCNPTGALPPGFTELSLEPFENVGWDNVAWHIHSVRKSLLRPCPVCWVGAGRSCGPVWKD
jgi:hypothetical protein